MFRCLLVVSLACSLMASVLACSSPTPTPTPTLLDQPGGSTSTGAVTISWEEASKHIGERVTVIGPVISTAYETSSEGQPTFLNIGKAYPDPGRFTVWIWGGNRSGFAYEPETYCSGKTIAATGLVTEHRGVPQMEVSSPSQIVVQ